MLPPLRLGCREYDEQADVEGTAPTSTLPLTACGTTCRLTRRGADLCRAGDGEGGSALDRRAGRPAGGAAVSSGMHRGNEGDADDRALGRDESRDNLAPWFLARVVNELEAS